MELGRRSPRRVRAKYRGDRRASFLDVPSLRGSAALSSCSMSTSARCGVPVGEEGFQLAQAGGGPDLEQAVVQREFDQVDHRAAVVQDQRAATFVLVCLTPSSRRPPRHNAKA